MELLFLRQIPQNDGAVTFVFEPTLPLQWRAGQSIKIEALTPLGPAERRFTISAAPYEGHIAITTRLSDSDFKQSLAALQPGTKVRAYGIEGDFTWPATVHNPIFIAGGIGITPYRAMILQRAHEGLPVKATLFYGSSSQNSIFKQEFDALVQAHPNFTVNYTSKRINPDRISHSIGQTIYISGPSLMVDDISAQLINAGIPKTQLIRDWFTGRL